MNNIELFYEVKNLFNTSKEALDIYRDIKCRQRTGDRNILYICNTRQEAERTFRKMINKSGIDIYYKVDKLEVIIKEKTIRFTDITEFSKHTDGRRYEIVRFLG